MKEFTVNHQELEKFAFSILTRYGVNDTEANIIARVLVWNNLIGRSTQGLLRLSAYLKRFRRNLINSPCHPEFEDTSKAVCTVKGNNGFGPYLAYTGMERAISIAEDCGIGLVAVSNSNHFGSGAYYLNMAAESYKIGLAASNSFPLVAPYGGTSPVFGTNPFAFGAPVKTGGPILVDFSTGALAGSSIRDAIRENKFLPEGAVIDNEGNEVLDPEKASKGAILPFGGAKGYCLGFMVEILCGVIGRSAISHEIASLFKHLDRPSRVGHIFIAVDISKIMSLDEYFERMTKLVSFVKLSKKQNEVQEILLPGETRWRNYKRQMSEGIHVDRETLVEMTALANEAGTQTPW